MPPMLDTPVRTVNGLSTDDLMDPAMTETPPMPGRQLSEGQLDKLELIKQMSPAADIDAVRVSIEAFMAELPPLPVPGSGRVTWAM